MEGSSPPSVFIGSYAYPKVYAGPIITGLHGDTRIMDAPESWIPSCTTQEEIIIPVVPGPGKTTGSCWGYWKSVRGKTPGNSPVIFFCGE